MNSLLSVCVLLVVITVIPGLNGAYLTVKGKDFYYNNVKVFLSGTNIAWSQYGRDFGGNNAYNGQRKTYTDWMDEVKLNGGNTIRVWVHTGGDFSPAQDNSGGASGADTQAIIDDLKNLLDDAKQRDIFVVLCLWNLAHKSDKGELNGYINVESKMQSYLDNVLKKMVIALKTYPALAAWDIINEPFGSIPDDQPNDELCWKTDNLKGTGPRWSGDWISVQNVQRFINHCASVIKTNDPKALVTVGAWSSLSTSPSTLCNQCYNYWSDRCLMLAKQPNGTLDFFQIHTYTYNGVYAAHSPLKHSASDYSFDRPVVVGEFSADSSESHDSEIDYKYIYNHGYNGAWSWHYKESPPQSDTRSVIDKGMRALKSLTPKSNGVILITIG